MPGKGKTIGQDQLRRTRPLHTRRLLTSGQRPVMPVPRPTTRQVFSRDLPPTTQKAQNTRTARKTTLCGCHRRRAIHLMKALQTKTMSPEHAAQSCAVRLHRYLQWSCRPSTRPAIWQSRILTGTRNPTKHPANALRIASQNLRPLPLLHLKESLLPHLRRCKTEGRHRRKRVRGHRSLVGTADQSLWASSRDSSQLLRQTSSRRTDVHHPRSNTNTHRLPKANRSPKAITQITNTMMNPLPRSHRLKMNRSLRLVSLRRSRILEATSPWVKPLLRTPNTRLQTPLWRPHSRHHKHLTELFRHTMTTLRALLPLSLLGSIAVCGTACTQKSVSSSSHPVLSRRSIFHKPSLLLVTRTGVLRHEASSLLSPWSSRLWSLYVEAQR